VDIPVKFLTGQGEISLHRRYETPQMYVSLTLYSDSPISTKKTLNRRKQGHFPMVVQSHTNLFDGGVRKIRTSHWCCFEHCWCISEWTLQSYDG